MSAVILVPMLRVEEAPDDPCAIPEPPVPMLRREPPYHPDGMLLSDQFWSWFFCLSFLELIVVAVLIR